MAVADRFLARLRGLVLWQPTGLARYAVLAGVLCLTLAVAYVHHHFGLRYEFHAFFGLPVLLAAWLLGPLVGLAVVGLVVWLWFLIDAHLQAGADAALVFNSLMRLLIALVEVWFLRFLRDALERETRLARIDPLTGLSNRRDFFERGQQVLAATARSREPFCAVFIDLDHFKLVNDRLGHEVGDHLLEQVARVLRSEIRTMDLVGRMGGDEFALLLPNTRADEVMSLIERIRLRLRLVMQENGWPVTLSIGIASYETLPGDLEMIVNAADELMYEVKQSGRNRVVQRNLG
ncbi:GGDEF domain-containing protein [Magnetovirga frankeli]|uniref:GGDEF domain-containing protein n=1 Tax=Magnetovirga frankeli TaxID=947516 RepID=UPI0012932EEA|nr:GGDEF domain-containing protein [gamma proteobacterium SS-5]